MNLILGVLHRENLGVTARSTGMIFQLPGTKNKFLSRLAYRPVTHLKSFYWFLHQFYCLPWLQKMGKCENPKSRVVCNRHYNRTRLSS